MPSTHAQFNEIVSVGTAVGVGEGLEYIQPASTLGIVCTLESQLCAANDFVDLFVRKNRPLERIRPFSADTFVYRPELRNHSVLSVSFGLLAK